MSRSILIGVWILLFVPHASWSQGHELQFAAYAPNVLFEKLMGDHAWRIFATGEIDIDAGKRLAELIKRKEIPRGSRLFLNSPGGNAVGAMALGRVIRENRLGTYIGQFDPKQKFGGSKPGYCYSACAIAFLGGEYRYWTDGSVYGVHRFFWEDHSDNPSDSDKVMAAAQIMSATLIEYIRSMDVNTRIFSIASESGRSEVITPSHETLLELNVMNDGRKQPKWTIESVANDDFKGMYLKGEQETDNGLNKFLLVCPVDAPMFLFIFFEVGDNGDEVSTWPVNWLFIDDKQIRIDDLLQDKRIKDGLASLTYRADQRILDKIAHAKTVGVGLQSGPEGAVFSGFNYMPFEGGAAKLPGFLAVCHHGN